MTQKPLRSSDPRPGGVPYYIAKECVECGATLILDPDNQGWLDEFTCPKCNNGIYLDYPPEHTARIQRRRRLKMKNYPLIGRKEPHHDA